MLTLGKTNLCSCIEACSPEFDAVLLADLSPKVLATILWLLCELTPTTRITALRAHTYEDICNMCVRAKERTWTGKPEGYRTMVQGLLSHKCEDTYVYDVAKEMGFEKKQPKQLTQKQKESESYYATLFAGKSATGKKDDKDVSASSQPAASVGANPASAASAASPAPAAPAAPAASAVRAPSNAVPAPTPKARNGKRKRNTQSRRTEAARLATSTDEESMGNSMEMLGLPPSRRWLRPRPRLAPRRMMIEDGSVSDDQAPPASPAPDPANQAAPATQGLPAPATPALPLGPRAPATPGPAPGTPAPGTPFPGTPAPGTPPMPCQFCMEPLQDGSELEALRCGHTYHARCIKQYCSATGRDRTSACALGSRCTYTDNQEE